jgi:hypothetical protein
MVELLCPQCARVHWEIDSDYRGIGGGFIQYSDREYTCPACTRHGANYRLLRQSPSEFFLQPHGLIPMNTREFATWFAILREHFPNSEVLGTVGITWYPGSRRHAHEARLSKIQSIGKVKDYWFMLSNRSPDDVRPRVCVQRDGEAHFWLDPIELDRCYYGFDQAELREIEDILNLYATDIRTAWSEFKAFGVISQASFDAELLQSQRKPWWRIW